MFVGVLRRYQVELRADFQQYYNLNLDGLGLGYSVRHAADLTAMLPVSSRVRCAIDPANAWREQEYLLANIANSIKLISWQLAGGKKQHEPAWVKPPQPKKQTERPDVVCSVAEYQRRLRLPRKEVSHGNTGDINCPAGAEA